MAWAATADDGGGELARIDEGIQRVMLRNEARAVETEIKFAGYLDQQKRSVEKLKAAEAVAIPEWLDYGVISGLSREMRETLERVRPQTIGQASRLPGVTPAAVSLVHVSIRIQAGKIRAEKGQTGERAADGARRPALEAGISEPGAAAFIG